VIFVTGLFFSQKGNEMRKIAPKTKSILLSIAASAGVGLTGYLSSKCARKADLEIDKKKKVKAYIPAIVSGTATVFCIGLSTYISGEEIAALTIACSGIAAKFADYRKAVENNVPDEFFPQIDEEFYKREIEKLEAELAAKEYPKEDDLATFVDSFTGYTFCGKYEDVDSGLKKAADFYKRNGYLYWCDLIFMANNGDMNAYDSTLGGGRPDESLPLGWSAQMFEEIYDGDIEVEFELVERSGYENSYSIEYTVSPEVYFLEY
jgi:hypothetical protein